MRPTDGKMETYKDIDIEAKPMRPHILAGATIIFGDDYYNGPRENVCLSGMVEIKKWPMEGFEHWVREDGTAEFGLELISRADVGIKGFSYLLNDKIQVLSHPDFPNSGSISQIVAGRNFPAKFKIRRHGIIQTTGMRLVHRNVIEIEGIVDSIPPYKQPLTPPLAGVPNLKGGEPVMKQVNVVGGVNLPEAWSPADEDLNPLPQIAAFFSPYPKNCISMLTMPNYILQASAVGELGLQLKGTSEKIQLKGDYRQAAGVEMLIYNSDRHNLDDSVRVQLARMALVGQSSCFEGRVMLRVSFFKVSQGRLGTGREMSYNRLNFPVDLVLDAHIDLATPQGELTSIAPLLLKSSLGRDVPIGATFTSLPPDSPIALIATDGRKLASVDSLAFQINEGIFGAEATVDTTMGLDVSQTPLSSQETGSGLENNRRGNL